MIWRQGAKNPEINALFADGTITSPGCYEIKPLGPTCFPVQQDCYQTFVYSWFKVQKHLMPSTRFLSKELPHRSFFHQTGITFQTWAILVMFNLLRQILRDHIPHEKLNWDICALTDTDLADDQKSYAGWISANKNPAKSVATYWTVLKNTKADYVSWSKRHIMQKEKTQLFKIRTVMQVSPCIHGGGEPPPSTHYCTFVLL